LLKRLTIQNYAIIDSLDMEFPDGLIIISGETGAGKSILLGALSLLLGAKVHKEIFLDSTKNCIVEAEFDSNSNLQSDSSSDSDLVSFIVRRIIRVSGRSRAFIDDEPVSLTELNEQVSKLIDIHAQHQSLLLSDYAFQLSALDYFSNNDKYLNEYHHLYNEWLINERNIFDIEKTISASESEKDYHLFQYEQLNSANLVEDELEKLEEEYKYLSNAEKIISSLALVRSNFDYQGMSLTQAIKDSESSLNKCVDYLPELEVLSSRLESSRLELEDIEQEVGNIADRIDISPERLVTVEDRISLLYSLEKKHNVNDIKSLLEIRDELSASLDGDFVDKEKLEKLKKTSVQITSKLNSLADDLSKRRSDNIKPFRNKILEGVRLLEMPDAKFDLNLNTMDKLGHNGKDNVKFVFSANGDDKLQDISKTASGGELSRLMLCLKALIAEHTSLPTIIFDEIDTGVSGKVADRMGSMISSMAGNMQIFVITHLPQIASKKATHYLVYKEKDAEGQVHTNMKILEGKDRVKEVARMLSGSILTDAAILNAKVLLNGEQF